MDRPGFVKRYVKKLRFGMLFSFGVFLGFAIVSAVFADDALPKAESLGLPFENVAPATTATVLIREVIKYIGILAVLALTYGGFLFMTAFGEDEKVKKAKGIVQYSIIGVILSIAAYSIVDIVNSLRL
jgi:hypothetical protein